MRRLLCCLVIAGFAFSGCSGQRRPDAETEFFRDFSLEEIVRRVASPEIKWASGGSDYSSSPGVKRRKGFSLAYLIEEREGEKFDESSFIVRLKAEAERAADQAGVHRGGGGLGGDDFHFDYSDEDHEGWVDVVGTRMEGNRYKIFCVITERTKDAKR